MTRIPFEEPLPDLAIVGTDTERGSGLEIVRLQLLSAYVPCVVVADWLCPQYAAMAREAGAAGIICLDFDVARIRAVLSSVMEGNTAFPAASAPEPQALSADAAFLLEQHSVGQDLDKISAAVGSQRKTIQNQLSIARSAAQSSVLERWLPTRPLSPPNGPLPDEEHLGNPRR